MRASGILMPISSLPSPYGIGTFGKAAYKFIDFLKNAKQSYWQVLPLGPTSYGDSPYQSFSSIAGNPYFIDFDCLIDDGLLTSSDLLEVVDLPLIIDYEKLYNTRYKVLNKAFTNFNKDDKLYKKFIKDNNWWLDDYATFMALKKTFNDVSWDKWDDKYKYYNKKNNKEFVNENKNIVEFFKFIQYEFYKQWDLLKMYANDNHIKIIGDIPIYVAYDSVEVWKDTKLFQLDDELKPTRVAGCPPDAFSSDGQLWGNPLYNWDKMKKDNYSWWIKRIYASSKLYDVIRIDHFRGFAGYYSIPYGDINAKNGKWVKGPGYNLFKVIKKEFPNISIIAEDLGFLTKDVYRLLKKCGYPGMKVLEFGFDIDGDSDYAPHNIINNCVLYTGTHDNTPIRSWFSELKDEQKHYVKEYLMLQDEAKICDQLIRVALASVSDTVIIPLQDYLGFDESSRINTPSTKTNNWVYRMDEKYITKELAEYIGFLTILYRRYNVK